MLRKGESLGPYQIVEELGSGGMASVYKAYHAKLDRYVAIKVLHDTLLQEAGFMTRFQREAQIIARLEHPNIIPVYDFSDYQGKPYLVMKFVPGQTLEERLKAGPLPLPEILRIMTAIADALTYAHQQGILHRDIKPANIILDERNVPYLTDFGLARLVLAGSSSLSRGSMIGTPHYISPEQALGQSELDPRTDIYSLGVVLYELVVGRVPFEGDTPFSVVHDHIYTPLPPPSAVNPEVPPQVEEVLFKALAKDPTARYETASDMMSAFRQAVEQAGLVDLSPERVSVASKSLVEFQQQKARSTPAARVSGPPAPPAPPVPPKSVVPAEILGTLGSKIEKTFDVDLGDLDSLGPRIEAKFNQWASAVQSSMEQEKEPLTTEEKMRKRIEERIEKRQELITHLGIYVTTNVFLLVINALFSGLLGGICAFPWVLIVMLGWGIGVVAHLLDYYAKYGGGAARREQEIQRELELARQRGEILDSDETAYVKLKHEDLDERRVRLTADGELSESFVEELDDQEKPKRARQ